MTGDNPDGEGRRIDRRRILGMLGGGTATVVTGVGSVQANPGEGKGKGKPGEGGRGGGVGPCTCDGCSGDFFCGKVEGAPEETTYTFSEDGEAYSVTVTDVREKEGGEVTCFEFSTTDDIDTVCIKGGPDTRTYEAPFEDWLCAPTNPGGQQAAISNFSFCGAPGSANYQLDLVEGHDVICGTNLSRENRYESRVLAEVSVSETGEEYTPYVNDDKITVESNPISFDETDQTATVDLGAIDDGINNDGEYALVGYEFLDPNVTTFEEDLEDGAVNQELRACDTVTGPGTLTIDLDEGGCDRC